MENNDNDNIDNDGNDNDDDYEEEKEEEELKAIRQKLTSIQLLKQNEKEIYIKNLKMRISELEPKVQEIEILQNQLSNFEKLGKSIIIYLIYYLIIIILY